MTNARFVYNNLVWAAATVLSNSVGSWLTTRPLSFLLSYARKKVARSGQATTAQDIIVDLGSAQSVNYAVLVSPKIHTGGSVTLQGNATNSWGSPSFTMVFPAINTVRKLTAIYFATQNLRYWRVLFNNPGPVNEYVELGTLYLGQYFEPTYQMHESFSVGRKDPSIVVKAVDGERQSYRLTQFDGLAVFFDAMVAADKDVLQYTMFGIVGTDTPIIFAVDSDSLKTVYYAYLPDEIEADYSEGTVDQWDVRVGLEEAR